MVGAGAEVIYTSQPRPTSEIRIQRDGAGRITNQGELEVWVQNVHRQGKILALVMNVAPLQS